MMKLPAGLGAPAKLLQGCAEQDLTTSALERATVTMRAETAEAVRQTIKRNGYESTGQLVEHAMQDWLATQSSTARQLESLRAAIAARDVGAIKLG